MRFVHSLARVTDTEKTGWCAPVELGEAAPHYISFVIPVDGRPDDRYVCEIVKVDQEERVVAEREMIREGKDAFLLNVDGLEIWFIIRPVSKKERRLPYVGKLNHADFASLLTEIEPEEPTALDELFLDKGVGILGCDPFVHYSGTTKRK